MKLVNRHSKTFYVYELKDEGITFYVGKGKGDRIKQHLQPASLKKHSWKNAKIKKMISEGKSVEAVIVSYHETEKEAFEEEIRLIAFYGKEKLTNNEDGGQGGAGRIVPESTRAKISLRHKGRIKSPEECANISKALKGIPFSEERKARLREIRKPFSEETRKKMSESRKGKNCGPRPQWVIEKIKASHKAREFVVSPKWLEWVNDPNRKKRSPITEEEKKAKSEQFKGKKRPPFSESWIENMKVAAKKRMTPEVRRKLSEAKKGKPLSMETRAKLSIAKKNISAETRRKMSEARKGIKISSKTKEAMSIAHKLRHQKRKEQTECITY